MDKRFKTSVIERLLGIEQRLTSLSDAICSLEECLVRHCDETAAHDKHESNVAVMTPDIESTIRELYYACGLEEKE